MPNTVDSFSHFKKRARLQLEQSSYGYHIIGCWIAIALNPVFIVTDYLNLPEHWHNLLLIRIVSSLLILFATLFRKQLRFNASSLIVVPLTFISLQNAYVYQLIDEDALLGQNLNYMALFIGASLFVLWRWYYSTLAVLISAIATTWFVYQNPHIGHHAFFVQGGLLLIVTGIFMIVLIQTRYGLTLRTIRAKLELEESKHQVEIQAKAIRIINATLEIKVRERTALLEQKNKTLENYAFINAHQLRGPIATIMGLVKLFLYSRPNLNAEDQQLLDYLNTSTQELDKIVREISETIDKSRNDDAMKK
ncbi:MAG TPA: histidine kinase dimerization/phospho-acceptor domain-containing protein [Cytophagaceae bacterium]|jgi:signal transduction histidine kinase|nr:histidine kinase dimerization/phospho-acceptor domain-containing protein [Cytophagaceae bacterium]